MSGACGGPGAPAMPPVGQDPSTGRETVTQNRSVRDWTQRPRPAQDLHVSQVSLDCSILSNQRSLVGVIITGGMPGDVFSAVEVYNPHSEMTCQLTDLPDMRYMST